MGAIWSGLSSERYDRTYSDRELMRRIAGYFRPQWRRMLLVSATLTLQALFNMARPLLIRQGIDLLAADPAPGTALLTSCAVLVSGVLAWAANYLRQRTSARATGDVVLSLRLEAYEAVIAHDLSFFDDNATGKIVSRVTADTQGLAEVVSLVMNLISQVVLVLLLLGALVTVHWELTLLVLALAPVVVLVALGLRAVSRPVAVQERRMRATINANVRESIAGIAVAKGFRQERALYETFQQINREAYRVDLKRGLVIENIFTVLAALRAAFITLILYLGGVRVIGGEISPGTWYLFIEALGLFIEPVIGIASFWSIFQDGLAAAERVFALMDVEPRVVQSAAEPVNDLEGEIEFRDVDLAYRPGEEVLRRFSLTVRPGETLALVGHTGAGKSSLARLIARFYEFQGGQIAIDGRDIRSFDLSAYRRQVGYVPQEPFLFSGTLLDNVRYGLPEASEEDALAAARRIAGGGWLDDLPRGTQTQVGERGANLSMGQRQLVALAQVLVTDPPILILDEATASVDPFTEAQIQEGLEQVFRDRTAIVIAHRLSTVQNADRIVVLERGEILEEGTHETLLARGGHYATLYNTYFRHQELDYRPPEADELP